MQDFLKSIAPLATQFGVRLISVFVILFAAWVVARWAARGLDRALEKARLEVTLRKFAGKAVKWAILVFAILGCLGLFGVDVTAFAAVLAASAFAVGLALQGSLSNVAAGVMLLVLRPFRVGDWVSVAGQTGKIDEISLFTTTMDTGDNRRLILPNSSIFGAVIENVTHHATRRVDVAVGTDYAADLDRTREVLLKAATEAPDLLADKEPQVVLSDLGASSVDWKVRVWTTAECYWATKEALMGGIKNALDEAGISIPFPQMDVHLDPAPA